WINRELVGGISSRRARWKRQGLPSSRRNPCDHSPYSSDPGVTRQAEWTMSELPGAAPATDHDEGSPRVVISGLNRTAFDLAVYASQGWLPTHPYAQLKGSWSCTKNGKPLFHHVLQCVSCWKKELPDGDCRQGRRDYTKCPGTRSRGTWAGDRCY